MAMLHNYYTGDNEPGDADRYDAIDEPTQAEIDAEELAGLDALAPEPDGDDDAPESFYCPLCAVVHVDGTDETRECNRYFEMTYGVTR